MSDACGEASLSTFYVVDHFNREGLAIELDLTCRRF
jgi:hypothetical protein